MTRPEWDGARESLPLASLLKLSTGIVSGVGCGQVPVMPHSWMDPSQGFRACRDVEIE